MLHIIKYYLLIILVSIPLVNSIHASELTFNYIHQGNSYKIPYKSDSTYFTYNLSSNKKLNLVTLDWPPYIDRSLCGQGWVHHLGTALLLNKGYQINIQYYPWARSVSLAEKGEVDILFPEYYIEQSAKSDAIAGSKRVDNLVLSDKFPGGNVSLMKLKSRKDLFYNGNLEKDLSNVMVGVVRGYQNSPEFDKLMQQKIIKTYEIKDDFHNTKLLLGKRVDMIVGDYNVIRYVMNKNGLQDRIDEIEVLNPAIQEGALYFAISKKKPNYQDVLNDINQSIAEFYQEGTMDSLAGYYEVCPM